MASGDPIEGVLNLVDTMGLTAVGQVFSALVSDLLPVYSTMMILYVAFWGMEMMFGQASLAPGAFASRVIRMIIIYAFAFNWATFETLIVNTLTNIASGVGTSICNSVMSQNVGVGSSCSATQGLSNILFAGMNAASKISAAGGWSGWGLWLIALLLIVVVMLFVAISLAMIVLAKVALMVLLGLGPFFIGAALFQFSSVLANGWLRQLAQYMVLQMLIYGVLGFMVMVMQTATTNIANAFASGNGVIGTASATLTQIIPFLILVICSTYVLKETASMAAGIAGGALLRWKGYNAGDYYKGAKKAVSAAAYVGAGASSLLRSNASGGDGLSAGKDTMSAGSSSGANQVRAALQNNRT